jgi:hypothetical protein
LLARYLAAGADAAVCDYNRQTALHVAAAQGKLAMVSREMGVCAGMQLLCDVSMAGAAVDPTIQPWRPAQEAHSAHRGQQSTL